MNLSPARLHAPLALTTDHLDQIRKHFEAQAQQFKLLQPKHATPQTVDSVSIPLTTVSVGGNFDALINIAFQDDPSGQIIPMVVDSGNSMLIIPDIQALPGPFSNYTVLQTGTQEPWGCPADVVQGPILLTATDGTTITLPDVVFYACTGTNSSGGRTANFGIGRPWPWSANGWNVGRGKGTQVTMQAPLSYLPTFPYAVLAYAPASTIFSDSGDLMISTESVLTLYNSIPAGFTLMPTIQNVEWMSVVPQALAIGTTTTGWPGSMANPVAWVDSGGGPLFLSDPNGYIYDKTWPDSVTCPLWSSTSSNCTCTGTNLSLTLSGDKVSFNFEIDTSTMPPSVQGLTGVFCEKNSYMMNQNGMNIGGISFLINRVLIDYSTPQVGFSKLAVTEND